MTANTNTVATPAASLVGERWRAFFAPVDRVNGVPAAFDPAASGSFDVAAPPAGWWSAGALPRFERARQSTVAAPLSGAPAMAKTQARATEEETVEFTLGAWSRLGLALSGGAQVMNLLYPAAGANGNFSGGQAAAAELLQPGSTASLLRLSAGSALQAGNLVVVDVDYTGQSGFLGSGAAGAYLGAPSTAADSDYVRRVSSNVALVLSVANGTAALAAPLPAGPPVAGMKVARLTGFCDRTGGAFLQEWSALFVLDGVQGERLLLHYPRLQPAGAGSSPGGCPAEVADGLAAGLERWRPSVRMRAMPAADANDGVSALCYRTYLPAPMRLV